MHKNIEKLQNGSAKWQLRNTSRAHNFAIFPPFKEVSTPGWAAGTTATVAWRRTATRPQCFIFSWERGEGITQRLSGIKRVIFIKIGCWLWLKHWVRLLATVATAVIIIVSTKGLWESWEHMMRGRGLTSMKEGCIGRAGEVLPGIWWRLSHWPGARGWVGSQRAGRGRTS